MAGTRITWIAISAVLVAALTGCGGGDGESTTSPSLTKAQFVKRGVALCKKKDEEQRAGYETTVAQLDPSEDLSKGRKEELLNEIFVPPYEKMIRQFKQLGAPSGDEAEVEGIIRAMEEAQEVIEANPRQALASTTAFKDTNRLVAAYGLDGCLV